MTTYATARNVRLGVAEMIRPPRRIRVSEGARVLQVANAAGAAGAWDADTTPYMVDPLDSTGSRHYEAVVFVGPARSGKTISLIDARLAYLITCNPADAMVVQMSKDAAEDFSKTRLSRGIAASPELRCRLSPRAHDDNILLKFFRSGMSLRMGWPSVSVLSGKDIHDVLMTDVDNYTGDLAIDECFGLALKRTQTYMSAGMVVAESSPATDYADGAWKPSHPHQGPPAAGIAALYARGDRRRWYWPCPECGERFQAAPGYDGFALPPMEELLERVVLDDVQKMARHYSLLHCPNCGVGLQHRWKDEMNRAGVWAAEGQLVHADGTVTGERPAARIASYWLGGVAAAYQSWESLIERYLQALRTFATTGEERPLKTTHNVDGAINYVPMAARSASDPNEMKERAEVWPAGTVPAGVRFLIATVDVQANRFVVLVLGFGVGESGQLERWVVDSFTLRTSKREDGSGGFLPLDPPKYLEDWERLVEKVVSRRYPLDDETGRSMPMRAVGIDWGGKAGTSVRALEFWRSLKERQLHARVRLVKGEARREAALFRETFPDSRKRRDRKSGSKGDVPQLLLNVDRLKDTVDANVKRAEPGPGYYHFPDWLPEAFYAELTAESRTANGWKNLAGRRNEAFDLTGYAEGLALWLNVPAINLTTPPAWAAAWDDNPDVRAEDAPPAAPPRTRTRRVIRSNYLGR
ncbi:phage terminase large subunit family protein [Stenotrophomonas sp. Marseille-Q5258]|jgi:phage terminase large subunit GpA-like protein|uniref:phage terminase large subunit family protein n=1 Tax=Stenotrophomonas sp. Marseille-Q5258 TaxID=2972779 RepID=UPI0021CA7AE2|nr:phage terminase large subunit family protein [Stenotrophomonas sp. Marseille-Q5258]